MPVCANYKNIHMNKSIAKIEIVFRLKSIPADLVLFQSYPSSIFYLDYTFSFAKTREEKYRVNFFFSSSSWDTETGKAFIFHLENVHMYCVYEQ